MVANKILLYWIVLSLRAATGKSPHGLCVESMFYLAMGATQLSYAIICAA